MRDLERRERSVAMVASKKAMAIALVVAGSWAAAPAIQGMLPLRFWASGGFSVGDGGGGAVPPPPEAPSYDPPATPTVDATVLSDTSVVLIGSAFSGDGDDTHDSTIFQATLLSQSGWANFVIADTLGAVERDTTYGYTPDSVYKARMAYKGVNGGYSAFSDSVTFTASAVPVPAFSQEWDYADSASFRNATDLTHRCSPDWPNCVGGSAISTTALVTGITGAPWGGTKAARTTYASASRATGSPWNESDVFSQVRWDLSGGTNDDHIAIRGWLRFSQADSVVRDTVTWDHSSNGLQKTYFVNCGGGQPRCIELKFGSDGGGAFGIEVKRANVLVGSMRSGLTYQEAFANGRWIEFCIERKLAASGAIFRAKVDTLLIADVTNLTGDTGTEFTSFEHGVNALPLSDGAWQEWGGQYVYADTAGLATAFSVCDFSGDG